MKNIDRYLGNKEALGFRPKVTIEDKKIQVKFDNLDSKYLKALSSLTSDTVKEYLQEVTDEYKKTPEEVQTELVKSKNEDLMKYMTVLLTHGEDAFHQILSGTIKIAKNRAFYNNVTYDLQNGWMYHNQRVNM